MLNDLDAQNRAADASRIVSQQSNSRWWEEKGQNPLLIQMFLISGQDQSGPFARPQTQMQTNQQKKVEADNTQTVKNAGKQMDKLAKQLKVARN